MANLSLFYHRNVRIYHSAYGNSIRCPPASTGNHQPCRSESIDNLSTYPRNPSTGKWLKPEKRPIIDRQIPRIDRFSEAEPPPVAPHKSSDNLPRIGQNLPTANRQVIVRCTFRIVRSSISSTIVTLVNAMTSMSSRRMRRSTTRTTSSTPSTAAA